MTRRRTYSCLAIARRHPRIFAAMSAPVGRFVPVPNSAAQSYHWPQVGRHPNSRSPTLAEAELDAGAVA